MPLHLGHNDILLVPFILLLVLEIELDQLPFLLSLECFLSFDGVIHQLDLPLHGFFAFLPQFILQKLLISHLLLQLSGIYLLFLAKFRPLLQLFLCCILVGLESKRVLYLLLVLLLKLVLQHLRLVQRNQLLSLPEQFVSLLLRLLLIVSVDLFKSLQCCLSLACRGLLLLLLLLLDGALELLEVLSLLVALLLAFSLLAAEHRLVLERDEGTPLVLDALAVLWHVAADLQLAEGLALSSVWPGSARRAHIHG